MRDKKRTKAGLSLRTILAHSLRIVVFLAIILIAGFFIFAHYVSVMPVSSSRAADGIVALTGGEDRIAEAVRLLAGGKAKRLLISGVNPTTNKPQLLSLNADAGSDKFLFRCCVDLGKTALNTEDNAFETTEWVRKRGFRSLILVTSNYHMPRSLVELRQAMPDVELIPYPVKSSKLEAEWWRDSRTSWVLAKEYVKLVTALVRFAARSIIYGTENNQTRTRTVNARVG